MLLKSNQDFKRGFWGIVADQDVLNIIRAYQELGDFFKDYYPQKNATHCFKRIASLVEKYQEIAKSGYSEYLSSMEVTRSLVSEQSEMEHLIERAYQEKRKSVLNNLPLDFYRKIAEIDASVLPKYGYCNIL